MAMDRKVKYSRKKLSVNGFPNFFRNISVEALKYLAFYKPYGVLSTFTDTEGRATLKNFIPVSGVYSAGRLDRDSEGLLLLSNDGEFIHRLTDPKSHMPKIYLVQVEGLVTPAALTRLEHGVVIQGVRTRQCRVQLVGEPDLPPREKPVTPHGPTAWLQIELHEGKKRQIRHMTAAVGLFTLRILRIAIGTITLEGLLPGEWRELTQDELSQIQR
jgi:23S rRNA pseudouridine2457 synthase